MSSAIIMNNPAYHGVKGVNPDIHESQALGNAEILRGELLLISSSSSIAPQRVIVSVFKTSVENHFALVYDYR